MNEITKKESTAVTTDRNDCRGDVANIDRSDLIMPRAKMLQALSPEVVDGRGKPGEIIHSLSGEVLPEIFTPIFMFKNWIKFNPRNTADPNFDVNYDPGAVIWRADDPQDPRVQAEAKFGANGEKPTAMTFMNFFSIFEGEPTPVILSFSSTSYKTGKRLLSLYHFSGQNLFAKKYKLTSELQKNDMGSYYVLKVDPAGDTSDEEYSRAKKLWVEFAGKASDIKVHEEESQGDELFD